VQANTCLDTTSAACSSVFSGGPWWAYGDVTASTGSDAGGNTGTGGDGFDHPRVMRTQSMSFLHESLIASEYCATLSPLKSRRSPRYLKGSVSSDGNCKRLPI